jgi:protein TonB
MSRAHALVAGPRLAWRGQERNRAGLALVASVAMHAVTLGCILAWTFLWWHRLAEPAEPPTVDVVLNGGGAAVAGVRPADPAPPPVPPAPPAAPVPALERPPQTPVVASMPAPPVETPAQAVPPAPPPPPGVGVPPPQATPVPAVAPPPQAELPPMQRPPDVPSPPTQMASLAPPPAPEAQESPEIRLGDGTSGPLAEILNDDGIIRRAKAADGNIPPTYPLAAARRGEHGTVTLRLTIGTDGSVLDAAVSKSSGSPRLDRAARDQLATWHFNPAMRDGKPQIDVIDLGVDFELD